ncbi:MAG TPA: MBL fold metallo-hydrolase [Ktedonobacteraceae bacterium]|jgi:glyoxylase-like metal-dependent hydrolase (beta-lactamase superfamily II)|nr:MBL fold metallo-hydrolase [Ktedonobacteraceae bacterium]HZU65953.1 MBL fold metallo-hydrolase [Ktedonobacteraceae bacterium]
MPDYSRTIQLGTARITIINVGDLTFKLSEVMNVPESEWRPRYAAEFEKPLSFPSQCVHIALPGASVLVDAGDYAVAVELNTPYVPPGYTPPPSLIDQLLERGIAPGDITHVVITHLHFDHYSGTTIERDGHYVPAFPNARYFVGRADWEDPDIQEALKVPDSLESRTLGVLRTAGVLELVEGDVDLLPAVRILAAPGESPGHQIVRVHSEGQTLCCLGDLYHDPIEIEHPAWMASWANVDMTLASRQRLVEAALAENALLLPAHMPPGRLERTAEGTRWTKE